MPRSKQNRKASSGSDFNSKGDSFAIHLPATTVSDRHWTPLTQPIMFVFAALDAVAYAADRWVSWMWPQGSRARRLHLAELYGRRRPRRSSRN